MTNPEFKCFDVRIKARLNIGVSEGTRIKDIDIQKVIDEMVIELSPGPEDERIIFTYAIDEVTLKPHRMKK